MNRFRIRLSLLLLLGMGLLQLDCQPTPPPCEGTCFDGKSPKDGSPTDSRREPLGEPPPPEKRSLPDACLTRRCSNPPCREFIENLQQHCRCSPTQFGLAYTYTKHKEPPEDVLISQDGKYVISTYFGGFHLWERATGKTLLHEDTSGQLGVYIAAHFGPEPNTIIVDTRKQASIQLREITTGKIIYSFPEEKRSIIAVSQSGRWLITKDQVGTSLWDVVKRKKLKTLFGASLWQVYFSNDEKMVATVTNDELIIRSFPEWQEKWRIKFATRWELSTMAFHPQNAYLASNAQYGTTVFRSLATGAVLRTIKDHYEYFRRFEYGEALAFHPDGKTLLTSSLDGTVKFWSTKGGHLDHTLNAHTSTIHDLKISRDGTFIVTSSLDKTVKVWRCQPHPCANAGCLSTSDCPASKVCAQCACTQCQRSEQCGVGQSCVKGACQKASCRDARDCKEGQICKDGACADCTQDEPCGHLQICKEGRCVTAECRAHIDCGHGTSCINGRCLTCNKDVDCGQGFLCSQQTCCQQLANDTHTLNRCVPTVHPCDRTISAKACYDDTNCPKNTICWWGFCVNRSQWETGKGFHCMDTKVSLSYRGADPDRVYKFKLKLPSMTGSDGKSLVDTSTLFFHNTWDVRCDPSNFTNCISPYDPVKYTNDSTGLHFAGSSSFALYRIKNASTPMQASIDWLQGATIPVTWEIKWLFSSGAPGRFGSSLLIKMWRNDGPCRLEIKYQIPLEAWSHTTTAPRVVRKLCKWPQP